MKNLKALPVQGSPLTGFTLIEMLIAALVAAIVASAALAIYVTQHKQVPVQDELSDMQGNLRAAAVELTTNIRLAGYGVPEGIPKLEACDTNPDTIIVMYDTGNLEDVRVEYPMAHPSSELRCDGHDLSGLYDGDWTFIYDPNTLTGEFFEVTQVQYASNRIQHNTMPLSRVYPAGSWVVKMNRFKYYVDKTDPDHPNLMLWAPGMGAQVYAENITDLNIQYVLSSGEVVDLFPDEDMVREIIININARTKTPDDEIRSDYRVKELTTRVKVRNLGLS